MQKYPINNGRFLTHWLFGSIIVWPFAFFVGVLGAAIGAFVVFMLQIVLLAAQDDGTIMAGILFTAVGIGLGYGIGSIQKRIVRQQLFWELEGWQKVSMIGGGLGMGLLIVVLIALADWENRFNPMGYQTVHHPLEPLLPFVPLVLFLGCLSAIQWVVLRDYVQSAWLWVLAHISGGVVLTGLLVLNTNPSLFDLAVAGITLGGMTGATLLWLFIKNLRPENATTHRPATANITPAPTQAD